MTGIEIVQVIDMLASISVLIIMVTLLTLR